MGNKICSNDEKWNNIGKDREQLVKDMIYVCCLPGLSPTSRKKFLDVCISWPYTDRAKNNIEQCAKYKGCPYWSEEALKRIDETGKWQEGEKDKGLRHEHIIPRTIFINAMEDYFDDIRKKIEKGAYREAIYEEAFTDLSKKMEEMMKGCVVTSKEADKIDGKKAGYKGEGAYKRKMPEKAYENTYENTTDKAWKNFSEIKSPWARYETEEANGIKIYEIDWELKNNHWSTNKKNAKEVLQNSHN